MTQRTTPTQTFDDTAAVYADLTKGGRLNLYGVADSGRDAWLATVAFDSFALKRVSLFDSDDPELLDAGPYLVEINDHQDYLTTWLTEIGKSAGILLTSTADFTTVHQQLVANFHGCDDLDRTFFFRFYDPRVLRDFLPTCNTDELDDFFGPIHSLVVENERGDSYLRYQAKPLAEGVNHG